MKTACDPTSPQRSPIGEEHRGGRVLAAATGAAQTNVGDIEVSAYLMDGENKELPNGEYDVRFGIYTTDRTEADPYPSDTDKGTRVWEETQKVTVENGLLKTYLGADDAHSGQFQFRRFKLLYRHPGGRGRGNGAAQKNRRGAAGANGHERHHGERPHDRQRRGQHSHFERNSQHQPQRRSSRRTAFNRFPGGGVISAGGNATTTISPGNCNRRRRTRDRKSQPTKAPSSRAATEFSLRGFSTRSRFRFDPTYSPTFTDITATTINATTLDLGTNTITDQNFTGDWNFNNGTVNNISSLTATTANFSTANITNGNITTVDFGTNTITDGNLNGDWNFNNGDLTNINAVTAVTGNFTTNNIATANITTANITTINLGTNTITDGNFTGDWNFNGDDLSGTGDILPAADMTYNIGSPGLRWLNVYADTLNIGGVNVSGQAIFTYQPVTTAITQSSVFINPARGHRQRATFRCRGQQRGKTADRRGW